MGGNQALPQGADYAETCQELVPGCPGASIGDKHLPAEPPLTGSGKCSSFSCILPPQQASPLGWILLWFPEQCASPAPCLVNGNGNSPWAHMAEIFQLWSALPPPSSALQIFLYFFSPLGLPPAFPRSYEGFQGLDTFATH